MKQIFNFGGEITIEEIPAPTCGDNEILVQNLFSVISAGTEGSSIKTGSKGIIGLISKIRNNPELLQKAVDIAKKQGIIKTLSTARGQVEGSLSPLGYSSSGVVMEVGKNIKDIISGDRVACAGAGYANHAEIVAVPRNLVCKIPESVDFDEAAFATLGAITLQGIRRAQVQLGDRVVVMGLGLLGLIACQMLKASGAYVIGIDPMKERSDLAIKLGADVTFIPGENIVSEVMQVTGGIGADEVIIYADTQSSEPVQQAMSMSRKKGKVVLVGAVGMEIKRSPFYEKELDFLISCSYGPGRYDPVYEDKGVDYPIGYVRWTENRNMQAFLGLIAQQRLDIRKLIDRVFAIEQASEAYQTLSSPENRPVGVLFKYSTETKIRSTLTRSLQLKSPEKISGKINVGVIGAGGFAQAFHLPNLKRISAYNLRAVATKRGTSAKSTAEKYGAIYCSTDYKEILNDKDINMVLIATRHNLHAPIICEASKAGKHIFVEKPIALTYEQCREVYQAVNDNKVNLTIGFNRRFSPLAQQLKRLAERRKGPMMITCRVNSAGMKTEHWINDIEEGGGAIVGEACHFFDFINWLIGTEPKRVYAEMISANSTAVVDANNIVCTLSYKDGSTASLIYTTIGNSSFPKERIEVFMDGGVAAIDDFKELIVTGLNGKGIKYPKIEKGQFEMLQAYSKLLIGGNKSQDLPNVVDGIKATVCSLKALDALKTGKVQEFSYPW